MLRKICRIAHWSTVLLSSLGLLGFLAIILTVLPGMTAKEQKCFSNYEHFRFVGRATGYILEIDEVCVYRNGMFVLLRVNLPDGSPRDFWEWKGTGFGAARLITMGEHPRVYAIWASFWTAALGLAVYPLFTLAMLSCSVLRRRRWKKRGCCVICAYDLRGSPSGICPECGTKI